MEAARDNRQDRSVEERTVGLALAAGFLLRTAANRWKLFCARLNVPPLVVWAELPGFDRLQRAVALAEEVAFVPEGVVRWLNAVRPAGEPEATLAGPLSAEQFAAAPETAFRERLKWWSG